MSEQSKPVSTGTDDKFERLLAVLAAKPEGLTADALRSILSETAKVSAESMQKSLKPENTQHPGISAFSYPEGDKARPRPVLPFELWWAGYPIHRDLDVQHWYELEQYAKLRPGTFTVTRSDGSPMKVEIVGQKNGSGELTRLDVTFPDESKEERKMLRCPAPVWCHQMQHQDRPFKQTFIEGMNLYYEHMVADPVLA